MRRDGKKLRHRCRVCFRDFPSGRSLGGHMKSRICSQQLQYVMPRKISIDFSAGAGCELKMNPKWLWRLSESVEDRKEETKLDEEQVLLDKPSENNEIPMPRTGRRSRRVKSISGSLSSASEFDKEQEDVALSLMMLSRDSGFWSSVSSIGESDRNSAFSEGKAMEGELKTPKDGYRKIGGMKFDSDNSNAEFCKDDDFVELKETDEAYYVEDSNESLRSHSSTWTGVSCSEDQCHWEAGNHFHKKRGINAVNLESKFDQNKASKKRSRYECKICSKSFRSYQALGGHRASHLRIKSPMDETREQTEMESMNRVTDHCNFRTVIGQSKKKGKEYKCPVCSRIFSSGQALGGHKRSHLIASSTNGEPVYATQYRQAPVKHDMLDLNLPAPREEDAEDVNMEFKSWWT